MWATWAFCEVVHISMPTPYLSIKLMKLYAGYCWAVLRERYFIHTVVAATRRAAAS